MQEAWVQSMGWEDPWRREWQPTPVFLPGNSMDRGCWWAIVHGVAKSQTRLSKRTCKRMKKGTRFLYLLKSNNQGHPAQTR